MQWIYRVIMPLSSMASLLVAVVIVFLCSLRTNWFLFRPKKSDDPLFVFTFPLPEVGFTSSMRYHPCSSALSWRTTSECSLDIKCILQCPWRSSQKIFHLGYTTPKMPCYDNCTANFCCYLGLMLAQLRHAIFPDLEISSYNSSTFLTSNNILNTS